MIPRMLAALWLSASVIACRPDADALLAATDERASAIPMAAPAELGLSADRLSRVDDVVNNLVERQEIAGAVVAIARHGRIAYLQAFGAMDARTAKPMTTDAIFRLASMTKPIVSVGAMMLYEEGALRLDDPVSKFIPEISAMQPTSGELRRPITVHDLLRHTSGIPYGGTRSQVHELYRDAKVDQSASLEEMTLKIAHLPLLFSPGDRWEYGLNTDVLGRVVEVVSGQPLDAFLRERVLKPLGMHDTDFFAPPEKHERLTTLYANAEGGGLRQTDEPATGPWSSRPAVLQGGGGMVSTIGDYLRFAQMLLNRGELEGVRILSPSTVDLMTINHVPAGAFPVNLGVPDLDWMTNGMGFGLGFYVLMDRAASGIPASAGSFGWYGAHDTYFIVDPQRELIGIFMAQFTGPPYYPGVRGFQTAMYQALVN